MLTMNNDKKTKIKKKNNENFADPTGFKSTVKILE